MVYNRRDIDLEFFDQQNATSFIKRIQKSMKYNVHEDMNMLGQLIKKPTREELEARKQMLKNVNCHGNLCTATGIPSAALTVPSVMSD